MFRGSFTALITPFKGGAVDEKAFQQLVEWQIAEGTHGLVPVGTTGESPTLSHDEHKQVVELCVEGRQEARARHRRRRLQLDRGGHRLHAPRQEGRRGRRRCTPPATTTSRRRRGSSATSRRSATRSTCRSSSTTCRCAPSSISRWRPWRAAAQAEERGRRQGRDRQRRARHPAAARLRQGFRPALGRGRHGARLHGAWRPWLHLRHVQRGAAAVRRLPERVPQGRLQDRARPAGPAHAAARRAVRGDQSGAGEVRGVAARR